MKDYKLKQRNLRASHTLGWSWNWNTLDLSKEEKAARRRWKYSNSVPFFFLQIFFLRNILVEPALFICGE